MRVLAGDIGGTNARLAIVEVEGRSARVERIQWFRSREAPNLASIVKRFLADEGHTPEAACFGVAGRQVDGVWRAPNLPWNIDESRLRAALDTARISVINDFAAVGHGIALLEPQDVGILQAGEPVAQGPIALIGAGTGLGESFLTWEGGRYRIHPSEGGHTEFAARDQLEWELRRTLQDEFGHVSWERVVSGPGLIAIYRHLVAMGAPPENEAVRKEMSQDDPAAVITRHGTDGTDALCVATLERFTALLGSKAGDLALTVLAAGGVYVAGGIAPRVVATLKSGPFLTMFRAKGRLSQFMTRFPVRVVMNPNVGLFGAAAVAAQPIEGER